MLNSAIYELRYLVPYTKNKPQRWRRYTDVLKTPHIHSTQQPSLSIPRLSNLQTHQNAQQPFPPNRSKPHNPLTPINPQLPSQVSKDSRPPQGYDPIPIFSAPRQVVLL